MKFIIILIIILLVVWLILKSVKSNKATKQKKEHLLFEPRENENKTIIVSFSDPDIHYQVDIEKLTCTCLNFLEDRSEYPTDDPRRLCKHLIKALLEKNKIPESLEFYREEIERLQDKAITHWITDEHNKIKSEYEKTKVDVAEKKKQITTTEKKQITTKDELTGFTLIKKLLEDYVPKGTEITHKDTLGYFSVTINNNPRKWICRLYLSSDKAMYIEFPNKNKIKIERIADIAFYKEELIKWLKTI